MNIVEQGAKGLDGDNKDTNDAGVTDDNEPCTTPNRANSSRVTLRKKHQSNTLALKTVRTMKCNTEAVSCCQPFLRSNKFVTGGWDCKVKIWDFEKLKPTRINEDFGSVEALDIYDDRQLIVGTSTENSVQIYDIARAAIVAIPGEDAPAVWQLELNQTNDVLVFGCVDGGITLYDVRKLQKMHTIKCYSKAVRSLKWQSRSEHQFFVSTEGSVFHQWDARKLDEPLRKINVPTNRSEGVFLRLHQNDQVVAAVGSNGMLYMYDAKSFALLYMIPASHQAANSIVMDEFNLYIGFANGSLRTFDFDVLPENVNVNPKTKITPKSMQKLIGLHGYEYNAHVY
jgi:WD40 repeat protein